MRWRWFALLAVVPTALAAVKYKNDFEKTPPGPLPPDLIVLEGGFQVKEEGGNRFLELPGTPLDRFAVLFGPEEKENLSVSARFFATSTGRRFPVFDVGLNGGGGYKLRVSPAKKELGLYKGDELKTSVPLEWESGKWTFLKLQLVKGGEQEWKIEGRVWQEGGSEPASPSITVKDSEPPGIGRASIGAMPYSGTPIRFDDLRVSSVETK